MNEESLYIVYTKKEIYIKYLQDSPVRVEDRGVGTAEQIVTLRFLA